MRSAAFKITAIGLILLASLLYHFRFSLQYRHNPAPYGSLGSGVVFYDRLRVAGGFYNLVNNGLATLQCKVMDLEGRTVFDFPPGYCHFFADGSLLLANLDLRYFDASGAQAWVLPAHIHHDIQVNDGETEIFFLEDETEKFAGVEIRSDTVRGVDRNGREIFKWKLSEHISELNGILGSPIQINLQAGMNALREISHLNSVQVLPVNALEAQHPEFRRGNILVNCFKNKVAFILDRDTQHIVWSHQFLPPATLIGTSDFQRSGAHSTRLLTDGTILFFNNFFKPQYTPYPASSIERMHALDGRVQWRYLADPATSFISESWGSVFQLANGNVLVTNTVAGSAFEIDSHGRLVWEWINPDRDEFGMARPVYRVERVEKGCIDKALRAWRNKL